MIKLTSPTKIIFVIFAAVLMHGCSKETQQKNFVARVNNAYLTNDDLARMIDTNSVSNFYKNEVIRNWINQELLYQQAEKKGILKEEDFKQSARRSERELAVSLLLQKYYEDEKVNYEPSDVENFYDKHKDEFKRFYDSYLMNVAVFKDENKAVKFRSITLESDWDKALNVFKNDSSIINAQSNELLYNYEIHPVTVYRVVSEMEPNEVSIVIREDSLRFAVVKLNQKFDQGTVPDFNSIKQLVLDRFLAQKKEEIINNYIKDLYSNNNIEVRN